MTTENAALFGIPIIVSPNLAPDQVYFLADGQRILAGSMERAWLRVACLHLARKAHAELARVVAETEARLFGSGVSQ